MDGLRATGPVGPTRRRNETHRDKWTASSEDGQLTHHIQLREEGEGSTIQRVRVRERDEEKRERKRAGGEGRDPLSLSNTLCTRSTHCIPSNRISTRADKHDWTHEKEENGAGNFLGTCSRGS